MEMIASVGGWVWGSIIAFIIVTILIGALIGWIAGSITRTRMGFWADVLVGIVGSIIGGLLFALLRLPHSGLVWGFIASVVGAVILLWILHAVRRPHPTS